MTKRRNTQRRIWTVQLPGPLTLRYGCEGQLDGEPQGVWADLHGDDLGRLDYDNSRTCFNHDRPLAGLLAWLVRADIGLTTDDLRDALAWTIQFDPMDTHEGLSAGMVTLVALVGRLRGATSH
jgi:hypothetical protein